MGNPILRQQYYSLFIIHYSLFSIHFSEANHDKFQEAKELTRAGGGYPINTAADFSRIMDGFIADNTSLATSSQKAGEYVKSASGATDKVLEAVSL